MRAYDHDRLAELLAALRPTPQGWVAAAQELPRLRLALDELMRQAEHDAELKAQLVDDLESALAQAGIEPGPRILEQARALLRSA
jgi:hypothetical protein